MSLRLAKLAELVGGKLTGDGQLEIRGAATLGDALPGDITLADNIGYSDLLNGCAATAAVVTPQVVPDGMAFITVENARDAFATIIGAFCPPRQSSLPQISPAAHISPTATLADRVTVYPGCVIGDEVEIASGCVLHPGVTLMAGCRLGRDVTIFPNAVLYPDTQVGPRVTIHAGSVIGGYGFGYEMHDGRHALSPQLGNVVIEADVDIGAGTTIDRGTFGATRIGEGTKIDNQVMIGHNCRIGKHNLLCAHVGIAGSCTTGDFVVMAGQVGLRDHVQIADGVMIGAQAGVSESLLEGGKYLGSPAVPIRQEIQCLMARQKLPELRKLVRKLEREMARADRNPASAQQPISPDARTSDAA